jgi:large subunit ribosomal protein L5
MNPMKKIKVEKITLNIGAGKDEPKLKKGIKLITELTGKAPVQTISKKRIPNWGLREGLPIGCKLTLRGEEAEKLLKRLLKSKENTLKETQFDNMGNLAFGIPEYIDIPGAKYNPEIGIMGLEATVTLTRPGYRVKIRRIKAKKVGKHHIITKQEAINFMKEEYELKIGED